MKKLTELTFGAFSFFNEKILRNTKEDSVIKGGVLTILSATIRHELKYMLGWKLKLQYPNDTLQFPLPNRWTNPDKGLSKQQTYMVIKQVGLNLKTANTEIRRKINESQDKSRTAIREMQFLSTLHIGEIENIMLVDKKYNVLLDAVYNPERELLFGDSMISGEVSYMLRKYGTPYYEIPESQKID